MQTRSGGAAAIVRIYVRTEEYVSSSKFRLRKFLAMGLNSSDPDKSQNPTTNGRMAAKQAKRTWLHTSIRLINPWN